jgi:hypothetical protein
MPIEEPLQTQMPISDPTAIEPFVDRFAREVATQEGALHMVPSPEVQRALMCVRQTWAERNAHWIAFGVGLAAGYVVIRMAVGFAVRRNAHAQSFEIGDVVVEP